MKSKKGVVQSSFQVGEMVVFFTSEEIAELKKISETLNTTPERFIEKIALERVEKLKQRAT